MKFMFKTTAILFLSLLFSSCASQQNETLPSEKNNIEQHSSIAKDVSAEEFNNLIESGKGNLIDVRTPQEFSAGNIAGAKNINIAGDFSTDIQSIDKNTPVYVYCASGGRSARAMNMMKEMGFKEVYNLLGGYSAWPK